MHNSNVCITTVIGLIFVGAICAPTASAQGETSAVVEEIIVTAQKREQTLAEIPMSISVLDGELLALQQADNFQDMVALVPGLSINSATRGVTRLTLRGINTGGVASTVGVYVADTPFGSSSGLANGAILSGDFDTFDIARVEVLRGPQGTLYGASSLGGVLKYVPAAPNTEKFEGKLQGTVESVKDADPSYAITGAINMPVTDQFAIRASGFYRADEGYIDSIGNNPIPALQDPSVNVLDGTLVRDGINSLNTYGGRFQALYQPTDSFSINLMALMQDINSDAPNTVDADPATFDPINNSPVQSRYQEQFTDIAYRVYSGTLDWDFGGASLQSVTSYGTFEQDFQVDAAVGAGLTGGPPLSALLTFIFDDPGTPQIDTLISSILPQVTSTDKWTQEFRLLSADSDIFEWLIGAYYTDEESLIDQLILAVEPGTQNQIAGFPVLAVANLTSDYEEIAVFANATWHITDKFELSFGARQSDNDQSATQNTDGPLAGGAPMTINGSSSESPFTWSISPRFEFNDNTSAYVRVATGFRPGGPNVLPPGAPPGTPSSYDSDSLTSYELGLKMTSANGLFALDAATFYLDWDDIQLFAVVNGFGVNANGGTAVSKGFEFTAALFPSDDFSVSFNGAFTDASLTQDTSPQVGGLDGDALPYVPEWGFGLSADYEWAIMGDSTAYIGGTLGYTDSRPYDFDERDAGGSLSEVDGYTTLNLRAGLRTERWTFELYGKNVTDEMGITSVGTDNTVATGYADMAYIRPATYGLLVGVNF
ncbi:MAG: TonB-dependent receptor [Gammaproteobacteria bacterium]|nr:TonB-dependent receptor [Gammaproteobacteria bacterium]MDH4316001.1 TonB-dependent receptor [Gammaproteobacteria bacterium]MDH5214862.1 TonB-dependent receptor [Gammaproteobacteria bacterium]